MMRGKMRTAVMGMTAAVSLAVLGACAQPPVPEDHFYRLSISAMPDARSTPMLDGVLEVDRLLADGITAGRPIVYSTAAKPNQLQEYNYHFWTEPPTVMIQGQLIKYLRSAGAAKSIVTPEMRVTPKYIISGKIYRLEKVVGTSPSVVLEIELGLREARSEKLIHLNSYNVTKDASSDSIPAAVEALNNALAGIFGQFVGELGAR